MCVCVFVCELIVCCVFSRFCVCVLLVLHMVCFASGRTCTYWCVAVTSR